MRPAPICSEISPLHCVSVEMTAGRLVAGGAYGAGSRIEDRDRRAPPSNVIRGRSADNRKAPLNFSFPLEGKCHVVAKGCTRVSIPMKLTIVLLGRASADLETLCRVSTKRRISVKIASERSAGKYQSAGRSEVSGPCMNSYGFIFATHRDSSLRSE